ncbi:MAG: AraC family transcriptional regulator [Lachnospiraceae bacterium]|nr:AraC family transcriptional regulator [Lachnospiraceae bacterium]
MKKRLIYSFVLVTVIPLLVFSAAAYGILRMAISKKTGNYAIKVLESAEKMIDFECEKYENLANQLMINPDVIKGITNFAAMNPIEKNEFIVAMNKIMSDHMSDRPYIKQIYLLDADSTPIYSQGWFYFNPDRFLELSDYCQRGIDWLGVNEGNKDYVVYTKEIAKKNGSETIGYISIHINPESFDRCFLKINSDDSAGYIIVDAAGNVVVSKDKRIPVGFPLDESYYKESLKLSSDENQENWTSQMVILNSYLYSEKGTIKKTLVFCCFFCLIVAGLIYYMGFARRLKAAAEYVGFYNTERIYDIGDIKEFKMQNYRGINKMRSLICLELIKGAGDEPVCVLEKIREELIGERVEINTAKKYFSDIFDAVYKTAVLYFYENDETYEMLSAKAKNAGTYTEYKENLTKLTEEIRKSPLQNCKNIARKDISEIMRYVDEHICEKMQLSDISASVGLSDAYASRIFKNQTGLPLFSYINMRKAELALIKMIEGKKMIKEVCIELGYEEQSYFNKTFNKYYHINPSDMNAYFSGFAV